MPILLCLQKRERQTECVRRVPRCNTAKSLPQLQSSVASSREEKSAFRPTSFVLSVSGSIECTRPRRSFVRGFVVSGGTVRAIQTDCRTERSEEAGEGVLSVWRWRWMMKNVISNSGLLSDGMRHAAIRLTVLQFVFPSVRPCALPPSLPSASAILAFLKSVSVE